MPTKGLPFGPQGEDPCHAEAFRHLVGEPVPPQAELEAVEGPYRVRVIRPGQPVTMDHIPARLNVEVDASGTVVRLRCG